MKKGNRFTDKFIRNLKPDTKEHWTREGQGFGIRVYPSGEKAWYYIYTFDGRKRFMRLKEGGYPDVSLADAREAFDIAKVKVKNGIDPLAEKELAKTERKQTPTVADFIKDEYIKDLQARKVKSWEDVERALMYDVVPRWGKRKITDIIRRDITLLRDEVKERAPIMANRTLAYISGMFSFAIDQDVIKVSPYTNIKRATKEAPKERALSEVEIKQLWLALDSPGLLMSPETKTALKLILLTAQRPGEVVGMHTKEISGNWWTIPRERTKNGKTHVVYLSSTALELIGETKDRGYIFPAGHGKNGCMSVNALTFATRRNIMGHAVKTDKAKRRKGEEYKRGPYKTDKPLPENPNRIGIEMFGAHDLRRTAATLMAKEKVPFETRERVLNHTMGKLDDTYNQHDFDDEKIMAMQSLERKVVSITTTGKQGNVISITRKAS